VRTSLIGGQRVLIKGDFKLFAGERVGAIQTRNYTSPGNPDAQGGGYQPIEFWGTDRGR